MMCTSGFKFVNIYSYICLLIRLHLAIYLHLVVFVGFLEVPLLNLLSVAILFK